MKETHDKKKPYRFQKDASSFIVKKVEDNLFRTHDGVLKSNSGREYSVGLFSLMGSGKSFMCGIILDSPVFRSVISVVIAPSKGNVVDQMEESLRESLEDGDRVIRVDEDTIRTLTPEPGQVLVLSREASVGFDRDGNFNKKISSVFARQNIFTFIRRAAELGIETVFLSDEAHIQGESKNGWFDHVSYVAGYTPIRVEVTATPDRVEVTERWDVPVAGPIAAGLIRGKVQSNAGVTDGDKSSRTAFQWSVIYGVERVRMLRDVFAEHMETCRPCRRLAKSGKRLASPKGLTQAANMEEVKAYIEAYRLLGITEENGKLLVCTSSHHTRDKDGNRIDPRSVNDPDSPVEIVLHHKSLNEGFDAPCLQVFIVNFNSGSYDFALQGFGRCVRTNGGVIHEWKNADGGDDGINDVFIYSNESHSGHAQFMRAVNGFIPLVLPTEQREDFVADLMASNMPCEWVKRVNRSDIFEAKDGSSDDFGDRFKEELRAARSSGFSLFFSNEVVLEGNRMHSSVTTIDGFGGQTEPEQVRTSLPVAPDEDAMKKYLESLIASEIEGLGIFGARNRSAQDKVVPAMFKMCSQMIRYNATFKALLEDEPTTRNASDKERVYRVILGMFSQWKPIVESTLEHFVPNPNREQRATDSTTIDMEDYLESLSLVRGYSHRVSIPTIMDNRWAIRVEDKPYRSQVKATAPEELAEKALLDMRETVWLHKNEGRKKGKSPSIANPYAGKKGKNDSPDYILGYDLGGSRVLALIEVKEYAEAEDEDVFNLANAYQDYARKHGIPAFVMVTDPKTRLSYALVDNGRMIPVSDYLSRGWAAI